MAGAASVPPIYAAYSCAVCKDCRSEKKVSLPSVQLATLVLATLPSGEVLITKRLAKNMGNHDSMWVFPGVVVRVGHSQTVEEAAQCDFTKETGLTLHPDSVHPLALWQAQDLHSGKAYLVVCLTASIAGHDTALSAQSALKVQSSKVAACAFLPTDTWPYLLPEKVRLQKQAPSMPEEQHPRAGSKLGGCMIRDAAQGDHEVRLDAIASTISGVHQFALHQLYLKTS